MNTYQTLARAIAARKRCFDKSNTEWYMKWTQLIEALVEEFPHGSGFDNGTKLDLDRNDCLVFETSFHHMDEQGGYDGWTEHTVTVKPDLEMGYRLTISGRDRNQIKEYIHECFAAALDADSTPIEIKLGLAKEVTA